MMPSAILDSVMEICSRWSCDPPLDPALGRQLPNDFGGPDNAACRVEHGRNRQRDLDSGAVLAESRCLKLRNGLTPLDRFEDARFFNPLLGRDQHRNVPPHHLIGAIPENPFRGCVPGRDHALQRLGDNAHRRGIDGTS